MRTLRELLFALPLAALCLAFVASAQEQGAPQVSEAQMACYQKCSKPMEACTKKCNNNGRCMANCAKDLGKCTEKCGPPPVAPAPQNP